MSFVRDFGRPEEEGDADLPVGEPTHHSFVINLKTVKAMGLTIPQSALFPEDQVLR
jgi:ABC-type uncharacterized transport system substrate-binding protein